MPIFDFKALNPAGKAQRGMVEAENLKAARHKLKKQGLMVTDIAEKGAAKGTGVAGTTASIPLFGGRVSLQQITMMTRQLASLVKANIPLVEALSALVEQIENPALKVILAQVRQEVNEGISLGKALAKHPRAFDTIFVNMIEAGESSGTLGVVMLKLADLKEAQMRLRQKVISGMSYPIIILFIALAMLIGIFTVLIPKIATIFEDSGKPMPAMTQFMLAISNALVSYWYLFVGGTILAAVTFRRFIRSKEGRPKWDAFQLKLPLFGPLIRAVAVTRFASTMSTLLATGVPILTAMNIAKNLVDNVPIANAITNARENITEGQSIAEPLRRSGEFPPMVIHMIQIGEKTGELPEMLKNVASTYEDQVNAKIAAMTSAIEPIMIVGMGLMVGFIVFTVLTPLMEMNNIR